MIILSTIIFVIANLSHISCIDTLLRMLSHIKAIVSFTYVQFRNWGLCCFFWASCRYHAFSLGQPRSFYQRLYTMCMKIMETNVFLYL